MFNIFQDNQSSLRRFLPPVSVFVLALAVRLLIVFELKQHSPFFEFPAIDALTYDKLARAFASTGQWPYSGAFYQPPAYPVFLAMVYKIFGFSYTWPRVIQAIIGASSCLLVYAVGRRLSNGWVAWLSGMICAFYGPMIYFELDLLAPVLIIFWSLAGLWLALLAFARPHFVKFLLAGICTGIAVTAWPLTGVFCVSILAVVLWRFFRKPQKAVLYCFAVIAGLSLPVLPVTGYNFSQGEQVIFSTNGALTFYAANNEDWQDTTLWRPGYRFTKISTLPYRLYGEEKVEEVGTAAIFFDLAFDYIKNNPWQYIKAEFLKLYHFVYGYEIMNPTDLYFYKQYSPTLNALIFKSKWLKFPFGLLLPLAGAGIIFFCRRREKEYLLLLGHVALGVLGIILFCVSARFRLVLIPFLAVLAAEGLWGITQVLRGKIKFDRLAAISICLLIAFGCLSNLDIFKQQAIFEGPVNRSQNFFALGRLMMKTEKYQEALPWFEKAVSIDPGYADAWIYLGRARHKTGNLGGAVKAMQQARLAAPDYPLPIYNLARIYDRPGFSPHMAASYYFEYLVAARAYFADKLKNGPQRISISTTRFKEITGKWPGPGAL